MAFGSVLLFNRFTSMRLLLRFFFCAFVTFNMHKVFAQDSSSRVALFVSPALLQPASLAMQGGLRFQTGEKGSLLVEAAVPVLRINRSYQKVNARRTSVEWRLQPERFSSSGHYFALQASYLFRNISDTNSGKLYQRYGEYQYRAALIKQMFWHWL